MIISSTSPKYGIEESPVRSKRVKHCNLIYYFLFFVIYTTIVSETRADDDAVTCFSALKLQNVLDTEVRLHSHEVLLFY